MRVPVNPSDGFGSQLLGRLAGRLTGRRLGSAARPLSSYSELALRLESDLPKDQRGRSVMLAATTDESVAVSAIADLGWHLAEELGREVILVDGSFGEHGLSRMLDDGSGPGLSSLIEDAEFDNLDPETVWAATRPTRHPNVRFLRRGHGGNGRLVAARPELLRRFLDAAKEVTDYVLVQCAPVLQPGRSLAFAGLVDAALVVALEHVSRVDELERANLILNGCGARRIGLVLASRAGSGD